MKTPRPFLLCLALLAVGLSPTRAAILFVSPLGSDVAPYATEATAARSIQSAINAARDGDEVRISAGQFRGTITFLGKAITVRGAGPETVIDGGGRGPVVRFDSREDRRAVLDSVQITGGRAENGAGILVSDATPIIQRTVIARNQAGGSGAGILVTGSRSSPLIRNNLIIYNLDSTPGFTDAHQVFIDADARAQIENNTIVRGNGNAILVSGSRRSTLIINNVLAWNGSRLRNGAPIGRGICDFSGSARIRYNLFYRNTRAALLTDTPAGGLEDFLLVEDAQPILARSRVARNFDGNPRLLRVPPVRTAASIRPELFRPRGRPAAFGGDPAPAYRNATGGRNTVGFTGGRYGWR